MVDSLVQLNYVIPEHLDVLLSRYCEQNLSSPSAIIRRLLSDYVDGSRDVISDKVHPKGRRTTVTLSSRLLSAFEQKLTNSDCKTTKSSVIAALLSNYLPHRTKSEDTIRIELDIDAIVFDDIYKRYGPGPIDVVFKKAIHDISENSIPIKKEKD